MNKTPPVLLAAVLARLFIPTHSGRVRNRTRRARLAAATLLSLAGLFLTTCPSQAAVTPVAWYRLGENDPGADHGSAAASTTDDVGNRTMTLSNEPVYDASVSLAAAAD